jgi:hypothetical protein
MALNQDEITRINDLFKQLDRKDFEISGLRNELSAAQQTVSVLNSTIENNKQLITELGGKIDKIITLVDKKATAKK